MGRLGKLIFVLLPFVAPLPISDFFFSEADAVISTQSAWLRSPALGSVTHGNKRREAGDHTPQTHIILSPPSLALAVWGTQREESQLAAVPIRDTGLTAGAERWGLPGHNAAAAGEQGGLSFCLLQLLVFLQGGKVKSDLAHAVRNAFTIVHPPLA